MLKPQQDRVFILPDPPPEGTGNVRVPDALIKASITGTVIAAGPGISEFPMVYKKDDRVIWDQGAGTTIEYSGKAYLVMRAPDIMAKI